MVKDTVITVLIADDEPLAISSIKFTLEEMQLNTSVVGEAENGADALALCRRLMPDLVITDIKMPGMSGLEFIEEIRKTDKITQFIIISGYAEFEYAQQAIKYGVINYVLKPVKTRELENAIQQCAAQMDDKYQEMLPKGDQLINYIEQNYDSPLSLEMLAERFHFSSKYVSTLIKNKVGQSFSDYLVSLRIKKAVELVTKTDLSIKKIAVSVGYDDQHYFHRVFKRKTGKTPKQFRNNL